MLGRTSTLLARTATRNLATADMFCFQCEQTEGATGCTTVGVCGKTPEVAALQDMLVEGIKGLSEWATAGKKVGVQDAELGKFTVNAMFATLTNVNFDADRIKDLIQETYSQRDALAARVKEAGGVAPVAPSASFAPKDFSVDNLVGEAKAFGVLERKAALGDDVAGVQELIVYGLKGMSAYAAHAEALGKTDQEVFDFVHDTLAWIESDEAKDLNNLLGRALAVGEVNAKVLGMLDTAHKEQLGTPTPTKVNTSPVEGKAILFSGHDMADLKVLLEATEGTGINVYTHGEMLPAHSYPELKKFPHLVGQYGSAWQLQKIEFRSFPGPIIVSTNCIIEPRKSYRDRIYTLNAVGWPGVKHIEGRDFSEVIAKAQTCNGFAKTEEPKEILIGFGHDAVLSVAGPVIDAVKGGQLKRMTLIGGCDGSEAERNVFTEIARSLPDDNMVLTLGCAKYRINKLPELQKNIPDTELPRLLDIGQCNDSYSAVVIASALADAFECGINDLPLDIRLSWLEQKAAAVLLTLLHLGVKDIQLGPNLPAFITPPVLNVLVEKFNIGPVTAPK